MKIPFKHIKKHLVDEPSLKDISNSLYQLGHEHEIVGDVFDIEITPNRGDCLSLLGICRDIGAFYKTKLDLKYFSNKIKKLNFQFKNESPDACPKISFLKIEIDEVNNNYQDYLEDYFKDLGNKKNNFFTDISNYLSYEIGQPTHCYDYEKINNKEITFGINNKNFEFKSLLNQDIKLLKDNSDYVFSIEGEPINLAGVIGNKKTSCSNSTKSVLVECAYFEPETIIGKTIKYDIQSDAAYKFERGVDHNVQEFALRRFIQIVSDHASINEIEFFSCNYKDIKTNKIEFDTKKINKILGIDSIERENIANLSKIGFVFEEKNIISIPTYRSDIEHLNDIAEEVARIIGYDNIPKQDFKIPHKEKNDKNLKIEKIKSYLIDNGFYEVINFPFSSVSNENSVIIDNPLDSNKSYIRTNLQESLVSNLIYNENRQKDCIKFFEISDIYYSNKKSKKVLGVIASGRRGKNYKDFSSKIDLAFLKEIFEEYVPNEVLNIQEINRNELDTKINTPIYYFEITLNNFNNNIIEYLAESKPPKNYVKYKKISEYPSIFRDISYSIDDLSKIQILHKIITETKNEIINNVFIFDIYENNKTNIIKIGFRIRFQSQNRTLKDEEVDKIMNGIMNSTNSMDGVEIPGIYT